MNRHDEALRLADKLLTNIELKQLKTSGIVSKAGRIARLIGRDDVLTFLNYERAGSPGDGAAEEWIERTGSRERRRARLHFLCQSAGDYCL